MSQELTYVGVTDVKDLHQKLEDLDHVAGTLMSQSQQLEFFAESLESTGVTLNIISESLQTQIKNATEILENTNQSNNDLLQKIIRCENMINKIKDALAELGVSIEWSEPVDENKIISLQNLPSGTYSLKYENDDGTETEISTVVIN